MDDRPAILIVDDDAGMARTTGLIMAHKGYAVTIAQDGREAVEQIERRPFDIVLLDIKMPVMDGVETHRRIKQVRPDVVVVMMTGYAVEDLVDQALNDGAYGILYKPLDIDKAMAIIAEAKRGRKGALVLIVDDDPAICTTLKHILRRRDYEVVIAHTGEDAIAAAGREAYDVILIDLKLPTINGLETYLAIHEIDPRVVAIMMTAYRQEMGDLVEQSLRSRAYACLYKPFDVQQLLGLIEEIWHRKRERESGGASDQTGRAEAN